MTAYEVATIGAVTMVLVQIVKTAVPGEGYGIYIAGTISLLAVAIWVASSATFPPDRTDLWTFFAGWVTVFATAAGLHSISTAPTSRPRRRPNPDDERAAERRVEGGKG